MGRYDRAADFGCKLEMLSNEIDEDSVISLDKFDRKSALIAASICYAIEHIGYQLTSDNKLRSPIKDPMGNILFKSGASANVIINELVSQAKNLRGPGDILMKRLVEAKEILSKKDRHKIVFSTNPWDILTMSMRGIESCMEWGSSHCSALVGSVLCPYVGVIYSAGTYRDDYGVTMKARSVVRLVKKSKRSKYYLAVEGAYPKGSQVDDYDDDSPNDAATEMFKKALQQRIKGSRKIAGVITAYDTSGYYVPMTDVVRNLDDENRTYFDGRVRYR